MRAAAKFLPVVVELAKVPVSIWEFWRIPLR